MVASSGPSSRVLLRSGSVSKLYDGSDDSSQAYTLSMGDIDNVRAELGLPIASSPRPLNTSIITMDSPKSLTYKRDTESYYSAVYRLATYYFVNCSIFSSTVLRIKDETLRRGIEWVKKFESKCAVCGEEYGHTVTKCELCGAEDGFIKPDIAQIKLFKNWEGGSMLDKCNRYGWSMLDLCDWWIIASEVYGQPICLCKSVYWVKSSTEDILDEVVEEFVPIPSANAKMLFDESGNPGDGTGFRITDRTTKYDMKNGHIARFGRTEEGYHVYPARWEIMADGGNSGYGVLYSDKEIFYKPFGLTSINYGTPRCMLISTDIKAWIAFETRIEKYLSTGHPQGIFAINGISPNAFQTLRKDIELQMRSDPYGIPMMGIPPIQDKVTNAKWIPFMDEPTKGLIELKQELQERIVSAFGSAQLMSNDVDAMKGSTNDELQFSIVDRTLDSTRKHTNTLLEFCVSKFPGITDWKLQVVEPSDDVRRDELAEENMRLTNAQMYKNLGFEIISQDDGNIEVSRTPQSFDPLTNLLDPSVTDEGIGGEELGGKAGGGEYKPSKTMPPKDYLDVMTKSGAQGVTVSAEMFGRAFAEALRQGVRFE